jgi:hypothetical protein
MAANKLDSSMLEDDAVTGAKLATGAVGTTDIANDAVTGAKLNPSLVTGDIIYSDGTDSIERLAKPGTPAGEVLTFATSATAPSWEAAAGGGKVKQITYNSDATLYSLAIGSSTDDVAGSIAFSITPTSASNKILINFTAPQVKHHSAVAGLRIRLYRQIDGGGYSHVTALSGTLLGSRLGALFGNYDYQGDSNRSAGAFSGTFVDDPGTTDQVDYKFYYGVGDGANTVSVNRTQADTDATYTNRTRTHCSLMEIEV